MMITTMVNRWNCHLCKLISQFIICFLYLLSGRILYVTSLLDAYSHFYSLKVYFTRLNDEMANNALIRVFMFESVEANCEVSITKVIKGFRKPH